LWSEIDDEVQVKEIILEIKIIKEKHAKLNIYILRDF